MRGSAPTRAASCRSAQFRAVPLAAPRRAALHGQRRPGVRRRRRRLRRPAPPGGWITPAIRAAYERLHALGWAHSVEVWDDDGALAGGLYGVEIGGLFAAESKFHVRTDASKVALAALVERLRAAGGERLLDVQWTTPHLRALGARDIARADVPAAAAGGAGRAAGVRAVEPG